MKERFRSDLTFDPQPMIRPINADEEAGIALLRRAFAARQRSLPREIPYNRHLERRPFIPNTLVLW